VNDLFDYALRDVSDSDMVGITIQNEVNLLDKPIGISFRRKDQQSSEVIWSVFSKVAQSNARYNAMDRLICVVHTVKMPVGFGGGVKSKGTPLSIMAHLKHSIIEVKTETNCLAHTLIIGIARLTKHPNYNSYRRGIRYFLRCNIYCKQLESIWKSVEGFAKSNNSKTILQITKLLCRQD